MFRASRFVLPLVVACALPALAMAETEQPDTMIVQQPEIVVSATRTPRNQVNIPNSTTVLLRSDLKRTATRTLAEALQDVVGLDTGEGSDNGSRLPNVGMWGLKEFDALLFTLNGVPVGGPFNPSLSQIPVEDIDRIEIVKGPQGTMYGVAAFAGMIQVFTDAPRTGGELTVGGGSFADAHGNASYGRVLGNGVDLRLAGGFQRTEGWRDRTEGEIARGSATLGFALGKGRMTLDLTGYNDEEDWGAPLPFERVGTTAEGRLLSGLDADRNYAFNGAEVRHRVFAGTSRLTWPLAANHRIENTLAITHDDQEVARSFPHGDDPAVAADTLPSTGQEFEPKETSYYEDLRLVSSLQAGGRHELVIGAAATIGKTEAEGREFEFDQLITDYPGSIPDLEDITAGDEREAENERTFFGAYAHDAWTPHERLTIEAGGRFDAIEEKLESEADLPTGPVPINDKRNSSDWSGDVSGLVRLLPEAGSGFLRTANVYASYRAAFKPAASSIVESESPTILEPERTKSWEAGIKTRADQGLALDLSWFDMTFENMVTTIVGSGGGPQFVNAGEQRFKGFEAAARWTPPMLSGTSVSVGYAHHDARFVQFTFVTPDGQFRDVSGKQLELVPRDIVNGRVSVVSAMGVGGFVAARYQGERPFNRRNTFFADAFTEWDAGASYDHAQWRLAVVGRNLGDERNVIGESEIGDADYYVSPPARVTAELTYRF